MKHLRYLTVTLFTVVTGFGFLSPSLAAEPLDITLCYSGSGSVFNNTGDEMQAANWTQNGIITNNLRSKLLHNAVVHCDGVEHGFGAERVGYGLCKIMDDDGDVIMADIPYKGFDYDVKFLSGSGKWKGIKGSLHSERLVRSKPGKGAIPGTYQGCRHEQGTFELLK